MKAALAPERVHRVQLDNGLTVLIAPDDRVPVVAIVTWVKAGYFDEPDELSGIAHVLEHMYFKGTPTRGVGEIAKQTKGQGGYLNAGTIYDHTSYYTVLPASGFAGGLEIQADAYAHSLIDAHELAREIEVIVEEAKRKADSAGAVVTETLFELLHDQHRMRRWRIGREPGLRALTRADVHGFYRTYYRPRNTVLAIAGAVDVDDAMRRVHALYGTLPDAPVARDRGPQELPRRDFRLREWAGDIAQAEAAFGWRTVPLHSPDTPLLDVAAGVLSSGRSSRLYRAVRERKLASSIAASHYTPTDLGVFYVHATARPEQAIDGLAAAWHEVMRLRAGDVDDEDVSRVRSMFEAQWMRRLATMEGRANHLAAWEAHGDWRLAEAYFAARQRATASDVADAARRLLDPEAAAVALYRPAAAAPLSSDADTLRTALNAVAPEPLRTHPSAPAVAPSPAIVRSEGRVGNVQVFRTDAGIPVLVQRTPRTPIAYAGLFVAAGAGLEPEPLLGVSSLMTHVSLKGTATRTAEQIADEAERLGAHLGSGAGAESMSWTLSVPVHNLERALALLADSAQAPVFPDTAVDTERAVALAHLHEMRDDMSRWPVHLARRAAWGTHPYARFSLGTEATVQALRADDLRAWHRDAVLTGEQVLVLVGDAEPERLAALAAGAFGALTPGARRPLTAPTWTGAGTSTAESRDKAQTAIALVYPAPSRNDPLREAASLLGSVASGLGGRFFEALRDKQSLAYTVSVHPQTHPLAGLFVAYIATSPEKEEQARRGLLAEIAKLREAPVTAEEMERVRTYALGLWAIHQENGGAVMADIAVSWLFGSLEEIVQHEDVVRAITAADLQAVAQRYLDPTAVVEGVIRGFAGRRV